MTNTDVKYTHVKTTFLLKNTIQYVPTKDNKITSITIKCLLTIAYILIYIYIITPSYYKFQLIVLLNL